MKVAIVGSGPSGCYTAKYLRAALTKLLPTTTTSTTTTTMPSLFRLDIFERLPTPFGLVRFGVAPDHPEVKNVQNDFTELFQQQHDEVQLIGNVHVGTDVSLQELRQWYDIVVLAYGCEADRKLNIPGEDTLQGVLSAREFVAWYNGECRNKSMRHAVFMYICVEVIRSYYLLMKFKIHIQVIPTLFTWESRLLLPLVVVRAVIVAPIQHGMMWWF